MNVLCFGAHPDDVEAGMGATVRRYTREGHQVYILSACVPDGLASRRQEAAKAAAILGASSLYLNLPLEQVSPDIRLITQLDAVAQRIQPDAIYTHWVHDSHQDHRAVANAAISVARTNQCSVYMYELIPSGIVPEAFRAQRYVDVTEQFAFKIESIRAHQTQLARIGKPWPRGLDGLAAFRGFQIGVRYAEAFEVVREIVPAGRPMF